jgi:hypothetical protein
MNNEMTTIVDDSNCQLLERPPDRVACYTDCSNGRRWIYSEWTTVCI